jgi:hypothetical protein
MLSLDPQYHSIYPNIVTVAIWKFRGAHKEKLKRKIQVIITFHYKDRPVHGV